MKTFLRLSIVSLLLSSSGCAVLARKQAEGQIPKINADVYDLNVNTIYGATVIVHQTGIEWKEGIKSVKSADIRVNTPFGGYHEKIEGGSFPK